MAIHSWTIRGQVVGGKGVGKTSIIRRYSQDLFSKQYIPTTGTDRHADSGRSQPLLIVAIAHAGVDLVTVEIEQSSYKAIDPVVLVHFYDVAYNEVRPSYQSARVCTSRTKVT